jgi:hypothetical protein
MNELAGQLVAEPVQDSATSHTPAEARHTVAVPESAFTGQEAAEPVQTSAGSHTPADARQVVALPRNELAGHPADEPVHVSATSQTPAAGRHTVAAETKQLSAPSLQVSSQMPPPVQGSPAWTLQAPAVQLSAPLQKKPSLQAAVLFK